MLKTSISLLFAIIIAAGAASAADISGTAKITDGDTIRIGDARIRLFGIDAPERRQTCQGRGGAVYECGRDSTAVLTELTRGRQIQCAEQDRDRYGRIVAVCRTEAGDLGAAMVRRGWAVDYAQYSRGAYRAEQQEAAQGNLGLWSGRFAMPWDWRKQQQR